VRFVLDGPLLEIFVVPIGFGVIIRRRFVRGVVDAICKVINIILIIEMVLMVFPRVSEASGVLALLGSPVLFSLIKELLWKLLGKVVLFLIIHPLEICIVRFS